MEKPYTGRSIMIDNIVDLQIIIPAKKNWFIIIFLMVWLGGWVFGIMVALTMATGAAAGIPVPFIVLWLTAWTAGGIMALRFLLWMLKGREVITAGQGRLTVDRKGLLFSRAKTYDLNELRHVRIHDDESGYHGFQFGRNNNQGMLTTGGIIRFDYGLKTVKFAGGIDEAEGKYIIQKLKQRNLLTEKNFN